MNMDPLLAAFVATQEGPASSRGKETLLGVEPVTKKRTHREILARMGDLWGDSWLVFDREESRACNSL